MKNNGFTYTIVVGFILFLVSCTKPYKYKACFTTTKDTFAVGETVVFKNCSDFDGGYTGCFWELGEGPPSRRNSQYLEDVQYEYTYSGVKTISLLIGEKENGDEFTKVIIIK
jgi:hypothetical protein